MSEVAGVPTVDRGLGCELWADRSPKGEQMLRYVSAVTRWAVVPSGDDSHSVIRLGHVPVGKGPVDAPAETREFRADDLAFDERESGDHDYSNR